MSPRLLIAAPIPALLGSFLLLNLAAAPRAVLVQQAIVSVIAIVATIFAARYSKSSLALRTVPWLLVAMAALVCAPILSASATPHRWLGLFGFRLYVAPVVLPLFLLLWDRALYGDKATVGLSIVAGLLTGLGLLAQPDTAQLTAFAIASIPLLGFTNSRRLVRLLALAALLIAAAVSWSIPETLAPVPYVEGVFMLASQHSAWALFSAVLAVALPVIAFAWLAYRMRSPGIFAVSLYFAVLYLLAPAQVTPVPLLGFGAGPILGYFLVASQALRLNATEA